MAASIAISLLIFLVFGFLALRCLAAWGAPIPLPTPLMAPVPQEASSPYTPSRRDLLKVFAWAVALRVTLLAAVIACLAITSGEEGFTWGAFAGRFQLWDARHYSNLIEQGYIEYQEDGRHIFLVFYPLYVWVTRLVRLIIPHTQAAGVLVSIASYAWGCCWVYQLAAERFDRQTADSAVLFLSLFPFSFFFGTVMTESLFLLTTSAACYFALKHRWLAFGCWGALAALCRMTGVLVMVPAVIELLQELRPLEKPVGQSLKTALPRFLKRFPLLCLPLLGTGVYLLLNVHVDGDPFAFVIHQEHWHQGGMWIAEVLKYVWDYMLRYFHQQMGWAVWVPTFALFVGFFLALAAASRREEMPPSLLAYGFCYLIANYSLSWLLSAGRYLSCGFMFFLFAAVLTQRRPALRAYLLAVEAVFLGVYMFAYVTNAQVM